ncbi:VanZ family protein [Lederbergia wuyishanensis]|uniref:VanZ family protein n=1 Tax=Lederbergia wuyishanensis TaxID=1347903 RepID=A0ABU0D7S2_9BACI|nr:VanZ family protein [Lederbergia wuyishanensis]MCJ8009138.1 VanZ family protein [Lederbergia wuyishanensis]MDQ0344478.1 VanZ family protein [Lederbergia wuyishanensis]
MKLILRILPIIYMTFIWIQSSSFDPESVQNLSNYISSSLILFLGICFELAHLVEFGFLYLFLILAVLTFRRLDSRIEAICFAIAVLYGIVDEVHQHFVPFRSFSIVDLMKDVLGVYVIWYIIHVSYFKKKDSKIGTVLRKITN